MTAARLFLRLALWFLRGRAPEVQVSRYYVEVGLRHLVSRRWRTASAVRVEGK